MITSSILRSHKACMSQLAIFEREWPTGMIVNEANLLRAIALKLDVDWAAKEFFTSPALAEYNKATASAQAEYKKATAPALAEYEKAIAPARAEYNKATASAWAEYEKAIASTWVIGWQMSAEKPQGT